MPDLPHQYPFRFVEPRDGAPIVRPSVDARLLRRGITEYPLSVALEAMAQSVLATPPGMGEGGEGKAPPVGRVHLAGIEDARLLTEIRPGDRLEGRSELQGRFGPALKVRCELVREGEAVAEATLLLTMTD